MFCFESGTDAQDNLGCPRPPWNLYMRGVGSTPVLGTSLIKIIRLPQVGQLEALSFWSPRNIAKLPWLANRCYSRYATQMIPAKTDAQNATVSAIIGTELSAIALVGFVSRIGRLHICL